MILKTVYLILPFIVFSFQTVYESPELKRTCRLAVSFQANRFSQISAFSFLRNGNSAVLSLVGYTLLLSSRTHSPVSGSTIRLVPVNPVCPKAVGGTAVLMKFMGEPDI